MIFRAARSLMGAIDLDPASCAQANATVQAVKIYTAEDDGLAQPWCGRVWLNPPYGKAAGNVSVAGLWTFKLLEHYHANDVTEACLLIGANTETEHFQACADHPLCLVRGRIDFIAPDDERGSSNTQGHAIIYFGQNEARFREVFGQFGPVFSTKW